jgi:hypothetical protein
VARLRIREALALAEVDLDRRRGAVLSVPAMGIDGSKYWRCAIFLDGDRMATGWCVR